MRIKTLKDQRGDTILEVLIAVTVLSLILAATFTLANRNIQSTRQAAERSEAYKVAQSEIEKLKLYITSPGADLPNPGEYFCMSGDALEIVELNGAAPADPFSDPSFQSMIYEDASNNGCLDGPGDLFYKLIYRDIAPRDNTYTAFIRWPAVTGSGVDQSSVVHRIYPDSASSFIPNAGSGTITPSPPPAPTPSPTPAPTPTPPPSPSPITVRGNAYSECRPLETYLCDTQGNSVFNCQNYIATYPISPVSGPGYTELYLDYTDNVNRCSGAPTPPAAIYSYNIDVIIDNQKVLDNYQLSTTGGRITIPLGTTVANVSNISIQWDNNIWVSDGSNPMAYDPDLQINNIGLR